MAIVIDASVMIAQLLRDEEHSDSARIIMELPDSEDIIVPYIFWYEIRHVLLKAKRTGRIEQKIFEICLSRLRDEFSPSVDTDHDEAMVLDLAQRHNLSVYDASYLETALRYKAGLATFDRTLAKAAANETVENPASQLGAV